MLLSKHPTARTRLNLAPSLPHPVLVCCFVLQQDAESLKEFAKQYLNQDLQVRAHSTSAGRQGMDGWHGMDGCTASSGSEA